MEKNSAEAAIPTSRAHVRFKEAQNNDRDYGRPRQPTTLVTEDSAILFMGPSGCPTRPDPAFPWAPRSSSQRGIGRAGIRLLLGVNAQGTVNNM